MWNHPGNANLIFTQIGTFLIEKFSVFMMQKSHRKPKHYINADKKTL